jgi:hypothetical protein
MRLVLVVDQNFIITLSVFDNKIYFIELN